MKHPLLVASILGLVVFGMTGGAGCSRRPASERKAAAQATTTRIERGFLVPTPIGNPADGQAWITDLTIVDLDADGLPDVLCCDAKLNRIGWIRQTARGQFAERTIGEGVAGPAHVEAVDLDGDRDLDVLVASMGMVPPNNDKIGAVVVLENRGGGTFINRVLLDKTHRVTDVRAADLNGDGRLDLTVAQFGYLEGQLQWLENRGNWQFVAHPLLDAPGGIHMPPTDINRDERPDILALVAQDAEEVWAFENDGAGQFAKRVVYGSTNKDYGSSGMTVADVNRDGWPDVVYTNGDGFDYATPGSRPWHGVQWLENDKRGGFVFHRIGNFAGAYSPVVTDIDGDGDADVVAVCGFNDWNRPDVVSLMCFENMGNQVFVPRPLASAPTHLIVAKAGDLDGDGQPELVTGCFVFYPPADRGARVTLWQRTDSGRSR